MQDIFIPTQNYQKLSGLCAGLIETCAGIEMAAVIGPAGRGKTFASERVVTENPRVLYVRFEDRFSLVGLAREIAFRVAGVRPRQGEACYEAIHDELGRLARVIIIDEADRMSPKFLNTMRDIHDVCRVPVVLVGEEPLRVRLGRERRLMSRVREVLNFEPVTQSDVAVFYRKALAQGLEPDQCVKLARHSGGDFRQVVKDALRLEKVMKASGLKKITAEVVSEVVK